VIAESLRSQHGSPTVHSISSLPLPRVQQIRFRAHDSEQSFGPAPTPAGMVWIQAASSRWGATRERIVVRTAGVTRDALPIHRVYVDGF